MQCKIGFIGAGNMAGAIINGIVSSGLLKPEEIAVNDVRAAQVESYTSRGFAGCDTIAQLVESCAYVVLSVKPQNFPDVLAQIKPAAKPDTVFISIAAGMSAEYIKKALGFDAKVVRVMPNTPLLIGCGAVAISRVDPTSPEEFAFAKSIFAAAGQVEEVDADKMNEVIPLNSSSPAYIYLFAKVFVDRAAELGFDPDVANRLFCNTLIGSAKMMMETGKTHQELIDMVTSPAGTTFEGLAALGRNNFEKALTECFDDTIRRAYELGK
ncbi:MULTISPECIES: pyrroline-5-carboxylate reductase [Anaerotruncus]|jgi:pyrroline-5-carboxylate reductase|uniref:pyrroline-5-carboxylate reductase n=1 Tax=Anaerotruncus TaxID=244127 RepID=UPI00082BDE10|nr:MULTISPECIES: pyrroline-5-carboxylate reductase [Anaerotruncus]RGX56499.1 pyrroline-5-carboxylate reductase [Anaerotruncus sp. AF02-27]